MDSYYIFFVNKAHSIALSINVNVATVANLNQIIHAETSLRDTDQILLTADGIALVPEKRLNHYTGTGTESHPAFLYQKSSVRVAGEDLYSANDVNYIFHMIGDCIEQASGVIENQDTTAVYMNLPEKARDCRKVATTVLHTCAKYVQEHQFLHQGWLALISNMDDSIARLQKRSKKYEAQVLKVTEISERASDILSNFDDVLDQLKQIEVPNSMFNRQSTSTRDKLTASGTISLYEWISRADPHNSVEDLADQVEEQLKKFNDHNTRGVFNAIKNVLDQQKTGEYRDIKGVNKRFSQLEHTLATCESHNKVIVDLISRILETPKNMDNSRLNGLVSDHRRYMYEVFDCFDKLKSTVKVFNQSKQEILTNVKARLGGFIVQSYDKLNYAHMEMLTYEEKCNGIRLRLDLIEQIKEAPAIYARSVSEVVRRLTLKSEIELWHNEHSGKCTGVADEESEIRKRFGRKIEKHFLRALFPGMYDILPNFFVKAPLPSFDHEMPKLDGEYLRKLRNTLPQLEPFLKVTTPQIYSKLNIQDPSQRQGGQAQMRREESFFTREQVQIGNASMYSKDYCAWLSEDGTDGSPAAAPVIMATSPPDTSTLVASQMKAIPIVPSLQQLDMLDSCPETSLGKSAPIAIPSHHLPRRQDATVCSSEDSSKFSTPDDRFVDNRISNSDEQQFVVDDVNRSQTLDFLGPWKIEVATVSKGLRDVRAEIMNSADKYRDEFNQVAEFLKETLPREVEKLNQTHGEKLKEHIRKIENLTTALQESERTIFDTRARIDEMKAISEESDELHKEEITKYDEKIRHLEDEKKTIQAEVFKKLTIEYELMNDRTRSDYEQQLEIKDMEMDKLKREIEKKNAELQRQFTDPYSDEYKKNLASDIRAELEKEFKTRIELITKAVEQKKDESIARMKKECEVTVKMMSQDVEAKDKNMRWLIKERDQLRSIIADKVDNGAELVTETEENVKNMTEDVFTRVNSCTQTSIDEHLPVPSLQLLKTHLHNVRSMPEMKESVYNMNSSCMLTSTAILAPLQNNEEEVQRLVGVKDGDGNVSSFTCCTQTRITLPAMNMMVTVQDVKPGATVLVIWDERHNAYILFCSSQYLHFVKESSVRRLGLIPTSDSNAPRRNWILGKALKVDNCAIKKPVNRYNLPISTIVRRVEVEPVQMEMGADETTLSTD